MTTGTNVARISITSFIVGGKTRPLARVECQGAGLPRCTKRLIARRAPCGGNALAGSARARRLLLPFPDTG